MGPFFVQPAHLPRRGRPPAVVRPRLLPHQPRPLPALHPRLRLRLPGRDRVPQPVCQRDGEGAGRGGERGGRGGECCGAMISSTLDGRSDAMPSWMRCLSGLRSGPVQSLLLCRAAAVYLFSSWGLCDLLLAAPEFFPLAIPVAHGHSCRDVRPVAVAVPGAREHGVPPQLRQACARTRSLRGHESYGHGHAAIRLFHADVMDSVLGCTLFAAVSDSGHDTVDAVDCIV